MDRDEVPFVGRRAELAVAAEALAPGRATRFLLVAGDPGIGKSRLLAEVVARARDQGRAIGATRAVEAVRGAPHEALAAAVEPVLSTTIDGLLAHPDDGLGQEQRREAFFERVIAALRSVTATRPALVAVDDLHWADAATLRFLELLAGTGPVPGLVVALAYRSAEVRPGEPLTRLVGTLAGVDGVARIDLEALATEEIAELADAVAGHPLPEEALADLVEESRGNPLFALELARSLDLAGPGAETGRRAALPSAVRAAVYARLDRLPTATSDALTAAAVLGGTFAVDVVAGMVGRSGGDVLAALGPAEEVALVEPTDDPAVMTFSHPLICRVIYDGLSSETRAHRHLDAARALSTGSAAPGSRLATLAYHYGRASPAAGLGPAVDYARRAGDHALSHLAFEDAARFYGDVLELGQRSTGTEPVERCEVLLRRAEALEGAGETLAGRAVFGEAAELAADLGEADLLARGALGRAGYRGTPGAPDLDAIALLERSMATPARDPLLRAQVSARQAMELYYLGQRERRDELSASALALARQEGDGRVLARVLISRHYAISHAGNGADREPLVAEAAQLAEASGDAETAMRAHYLLVRDRLERADRPGAEAAAERLRELAASARRPLHRWRVMLLDALFAHLDDELDRTEELAMAAFEFGAAASIPNADPAHGSMLFLVRAEQGRLGEVQERIGESRGRYPNLSTWGPMLAWCQLEAGDDAGARATFTSLMAGFGELDEDESFLPTTFALGGVALGLADRDAIATILGRARPYRELVGMTAGPVSCTGPVALVLGRLAGALGHTDEARAHLEVARVRAEQLASALWLRHLAVASAELDPTVEADLPAGLSKREAEVLGLLAAGLTNKEVAARLHLSVRTVDTHVGSIYRKVGARHRTEAVAFALSNGIGPPADNR